MSTNSICNTASTFCCNQTYGTVALGSTALVLAALALAVLLVPALAAAATAIPLMTPLLAASLLGTFAILAAIGAYFFCTASKKSTEVLSSVEALPQESVSALEGLSPENALLAQQTGIENCKIIRSNLIKLEGTIEHGGQSMGITLDSYGKIVKFEGFGESNPVIIRYTALPEPMYNCVLLVNNRDWNHRVNNSPFAEEPSRGLKPTQFIKAVKQEMIAGLNRMAYQALGVAERKHISRLLFQPWFLVMSREQELSC